MAADGQISASPPRLVVGLGNPGKQYEGTRHNIGFMVLDRLASGAGPTGSWAEEKRWKAWVSKRGQAWLLKPRTFMNLSGEAVSAMARFHRIPAEEVLVVYDDMDLPLGTSRFRKSGSAGGHNGIRSIIQHLGTEEFPRLKVGIGRDDRMDSAVGHVLGKFSPEQREIVEKTLEDATSALECALARGVDAAMNEFNREPRTLKKKQPPKKKQSTESGEDTPGSEQQQQHE